MLMDGNNSFNNPNSMSNTISRNQNLNNMNVKFTYPTNNSIQSNIAGITNMPKIEDRFKNVRMDKSPAKQIMNSAGQNIIQNKIRGVNDYSSR